MIRHSMTLKELISSASLVVISAILLAGCKGVELKTGPCILDPAAGMAYCFPTAGGEIDKHIGEMQGFTALSPDDEQTMLEWQKRRCK